MATSPIPRRSTSEAELDRWNQWWRQTPVYQNFMRRQGLPADGRVRLSRGQQAALEREMRAAGLRIPSGMHIDQGGNLNQQSRLVKTAAIAGGAAAAAFGIPGVFPGLLSGGPAAVAPGSVLPSTAIGPSVATLGYGAPTLAGAGAGSLAPLASQAIGPSVATLGYGAPTLAGVGAGSLAPLASQAIGPSVATLAHGAPTVSGLGPLATVAQMAAPGALPGILQRAAETGAESLGNRLLRAGIAGLAGLPGLLTGGPSEAEERLTRRIEEMLAQQQARTSAQEPLFQAVTRMAGTLQPRQAWPGGRSLYGGD